MFLMNAFVEPKNNQYFFVFVKWLLVNIFYYNNKIIPLAWQIMF